MIKDSHGAATAVTHCMRWAMHQQQQRRLKKWVRSVIWELFVCLFVCCIAAFTHCQGTLIFSSSKKHSLCTLSHFLARVALSCNDDFVAIWSNCCVAVALDWRKTKKVAVRCWMGCVRWQRKELLPSPIKDSYMGDWGGCCCQKSCQPPSCHQIPTWLQIVLNIQSLPPCHQ